MEEISSYEVKKTYLEGILSIKSHPLNKKSLMKIG